MNLSTCLIPPCSSVVDSQSYHSDWQWFKDHWDGCRNGDHSPVSREKPQCHAAQTSTTLTTSPAEYCCHASSIDGASMPSSILQPPSFCLSDSRIFNLWSLLEQKLAVIKHCVCQCVVASSSGNRDIVGWNYRCICIKVQYHLVSHILKWAILEWAGWIKSFPRLSATHLIEMQVC